MKLLLLLLKMSPQNWLGTENTETNMYVRRTDTFKERKKEKKGREGGREGRKRTTSLEADWKDKADWVGHQEL